MICPNLLATLLPGRTYTITVNGPAGEVEPYSCVATFERLEVLPALPAEVEDAAVPTVWLWFDGTPYAYCPRLTFAEVPA